MRKNLLPRLSVKCLTKRDKVWVNELIYFEDTSFPNSGGFQSSDALIWIFFFFSKVRGKLEGWMKLLPHYFCTYLFIVIYYDSSAETLLWDQIQGRAQISPHCTALKIWLNLSIYLNGFLKGRVSSFGDSSSNAFFAHLTLSGTAITQVHSILQGREMGLEWRGQGFYNPLFAWNTQWLLCSTFSACFSVVD